MKNTPKPVYVEYYGDLWRLSERQYRKLLHLAANGKPWDISKHGKRIGGDLQDITYLPDDRAAKRYYERYQVYATIESCMAHPKTD